MDRYSHVGLMDLSDGLARLPALSSPSARCEAATGTDDAPAGPEGKKPASVVAGMVAVPNGNPCNALTSIDATGNDCPSLTAHAKTPAEQGFEADCVRLKPDESERRRPDSNRGWRICNPLP